MYLKTQGWIGTFLPEVHLCVYLCCDSDVEEYFIPLEPESSCSTLFQREGHISVVPSD